MQIVHFSCLLHGTVFLRNAQGKPSTTIDVLHGTFFSSNTKGQKKKKGSRKALDGKLRHVCCTKNIAHILRLALQAFSIQCSFKNLKGKNCARDRRGNCGTRHKLLTKRC